MDALVLACPLTDQTRHLISARELALMPPGAVLVNISRGQVVDEDALIAALEPATWAARAWTCSRPSRCRPPRRCGSMDNVIISPHSASTVAAENRLLTDLFTDNLQRWLAGRRCATSTTGPPGTEAGRERAHDDDRRRSGSRWSARGAGPRSPTSPAGSGTPRAEVVALADVDAAALAAAAAKFAVPRAVTDYRELLDDPDIDVVDVVTGNQPHFQISWDALSAGKHVLCEKPVHNDYRKTRQAAALAAARGCGPSSASRSGTRPRSGTPRT